MKLLEDLISKNPDRILDAARQVISSDDFDVLHEVASHIDEIKLATNGVEFGGVFFNLGVYLSHALRKLDVVESGKECLCCLYPKYNFYNPVCEQKQGAVDILGTKYFKPNWVEYHICSCARCGLEFKAWWEEGHYEWWRWEYS